MSPLLESQSVRLFLGGGYGNWNGTSFAAPQVAGLAALIFSANGKLTDAHVVDIIKKTDDLGSADFDPYLWLGAN
jgi:thermitase